MSNASMAPTYRSGRHSVPASGSLAPLETRGAALEFLALLARELSSGAIDLPCFPDVVLRVRDALADLNATPQHMVRVVGAEPRLSAKLLQTANSAAFNPGGRALTDLRSAITRLGHQLVLSAAMAFAVEQMQREKSLRPIAAQMRKLWTRSIAVACVCQILARRTKVSPDEAFLAGLLHGIGGLYILVSAVSKARNLCGDANFMRLVAGWQTSIGKMVLQNWGFAEEIVTAIGEQDDGERKCKQSADLTDVLIASVVLANAMEQPPPHTVDVTHVNSFKTIGVTVEECATIMTYARYQLGSLHDTLGC